MDVQRAALWFQDVSDLADIAEGLDELVRRAPRLNGGFLLSPARLTALSTDLHAARARLASLARALNSLPARF